LSHTVGAVRPGPPPPGASPPQRRPLRRYRESVCFLVALCLYLVAWSAVRGGYASSPHGYRLLGALGVAEAVSLALLFWLQQSRRMRTPTPWISIAWRMLPVWAALEVIVGVALARAQG
jgi:hypothetical protein